MRCSSLLVVPLTSVPMTTEPSPMYEYASIAVAPSTADDVGGRARALDFRQFVYETYPAAQNMSSITVYGNIDFS